MPTTPLDRYLSTVHPIIASGSATGETAYYGALEALLNTVGKKQKPAVRAVFQLKNTLGAGHPDFGLFTPDQFEKKDGHALKSGQVARPSRGVGEVKGAAYDLDKLIASEQVDKYLTAYRLLLATNLREFAVVTPGAHSGQPVVVERFSLAGTEDAFRRMAAYPDAVDDATADAFHAFIERALRHAAPVDEPRDLAWFLASYAREARARLDKLAGEPGGLEAIGGLREALEDTLGVTFAGEKGERFFRATVVQTLFYGVFSAWTLWHRETEALPSGHPERETEFHWRFSTGYLRVPVLAELFHQLTGPKVQRLGLADLLDRTNRLLSRVDRPRFFARFRDAEAIQYFYEPFLEAYDPVLRKELGVWYTPPELVRYMVARVDRVLREELGEADGLASENVVVLDPCCGTGAFLVETLRVIGRRLTDAGAGGTVGAKLRKAATERLYGFELLTAPFVVAHLQMGLALRAAGAPLADGQRAAVYLTNALTGWTPQVDEGQQKLSREFADEVEAARHVKRGRRILVVLGNPPYDGHPGLAADEERALVEAYRQPASPDVPRSQGRGLNDLYVRFFRIAERQIAEATGRGVICLVSNNSWLDGSSHPAMRERMLGAFDRIWVDNLNGDKYRTGKTTPDGAPDPSVFSTPTNREGIQVGTAVATMVRTGSDGTPEVHYRDFWGATKLDILDALAAEGTLAGLTAEGPSYEALTPAPALGLPLLPRLTADGYLDWPTLPELFPAYFAGAQTSRDDALVDIDYSRLETRMIRYFDTSIPDKIIETEAPVLMHPASGFDPVVTRKHLHVLGFEADRLRRFYYRPLDIRWVYWEPRTKLIHRTTGEYSSHVFDGNPWLVTQAKTRRSWSAPQVTQEIGCLDTMDRGASYFPLRLAPDLGSGGVIRDNLSERARRYLATVGATPEDLFHHALAVMHAPAYREANAGALRQDWPRLPLPADADALAASAALGRQVAALLDPSADVPGVTSGSIRPELRRVAVPERADGGQIDDAAGHTAVTARWGYLGHTGQTMPGPGHTVGRPAPSGQPPALGAGVLDVYLNPEHGTRWGGVPDAVWAFTLGGYPVLKKWLSYRQEAVLGRPLRLDEVTGFQSTARRLAALLLLADDLDASYAAVSADGKIGSVPS